MSIVFELPPSDTDLSAGLAVIRRRRRLVWGMFLCYLPFVLTVGGVIRWLSDSESAVMVVAAAYMLAWVGANWHASEALCPRCRKHVEHKETK